MTSDKNEIVFLGAGTIGTALGNVIAATGNQPVTLHTIEQEVADDITQNRTNSKYFPGIRLEQQLKATVNPEVIESARFIFLAVPSVAAISHLTALQPHIARGAFLINLAKGFGNGDKTIVECLSERFSNPVCTLKGPSFAREIINGMPTAFTLGYSNPLAIQPIAEVFRSSTIHLDFSDDLKGVELLSILKNIYAVVIGIVDAQFNSPNLRFLVLTKAFREMRNILAWFGGKQETLFNYCGFGDYALTALNDLSRNRTFGLLIGKGFFTEHVSHDLVLEGKTAVNIFHQELSRQIIVGEHFPIIDELYRIFNTPYDTSRFVERILSFRE